MTNRGSTILISTTLLAILFVAGVTDGIWLAPEDKVPVALYAALAMLSVLAAPFAYWLKKRREKDEKALNEDYRAVFGTIREIVGQASLSNAKKDEILEDILDLMYSAQRRRRAAAQVIPDGDAFARRMIRAHGGRRMIWLQRIVSSCLYFLCMVVVTQILQWLENTRQSIFLIRQDCDLVVFFLLLAFILLPLLLSDRNMSGIWHYMLPLALGVGYVLLAETLRYFAGGLPVIRQWLDSSINLIPSPPVLAIQLGLIPGLLLLKLLPARPREPGKGT